jgi:hypothetical protein
MARRRKVVESTNIAPVEEPTPEMSSSQVVAVPMPSDNPADNPAPGEGMSRADKNSAVINAVLTADDAKVNQILATVAEPAPEATEAKPEDKADEIPDEAAVVNQSTIMAKEAVDTIFAGEGLSEAVKNKAAAIFEATINQRLEEVEEEIVAELAEDFDIQFNSEVESLAESVEGFITDAVQDYIVENKLVLDNGIKGDLYENMITDISKVIKSYNIAIDDNQVEVVQEAYSEVEDMKDKLNEQIKKNMNQRSHINELEKALVFEAVSADLSLMQRDKLKKLAENVDADNASQLNDKLSALKEHFVADGFDTASVLREAVSSNGFYMDEQVEVEQNDKYIDNNVKKYVDAVSSHVKKV